MSLKGNNTIWNLSTLLLSCKTAITWISQRSFCMLTWRSQTRTMSIGVYHVEATLFLFSTLRSKNTSVIMNVALDSIKWKLGLFKEKPFTQPHS